MGVYWCYPLVRILAIESFLFYKIWDKYHQILKMIKDATHIQNHTSLMHSKKCTNQRICKETIWFDQIFPNRAPKNAEKFAEPGLRTPSRSTCTSTLDNSKQYRSEAVLLDDWILNNNNKIILNWQFKWS